jgi:hypothetical protein
VTCAAGRVTTRPGTFIGNQLRVGAYIQADETRSMCIRTTAAAQTIGFFIFEYREGKELSQTFMATVDSRVEGCWRAASPPDYIKKCDGNA